MKKGQETKGKRTSGFSLLGEEKHMQKEGGELKRDLPCGNN